MDIERAIIEKAYAKLKEGTGYLCDDKENDYDCALDELYNAAIANQVIAKSATSEEVQIEINRLQESLNQTKEAAKELKEQKYTVNMLPVYNQIKSLELQITALQQYQGWIPVSERMAIESDLRNGMVLAWSTELCEWQVENWGYVEDRPDDYTHWMPLPEPPKGE